MSAAKRPAMLAMLAFLTLTSPARAAVPQTMTVQGILRNAAGVPVAGTTHFEFSLLDGTDVMWSEEKTAWLAAGLFTVTLGATTPINPAFFGTSDLSVCGYINGPP